MNRVLGVGAVVLVTNFLLWAELRPRPEPIPYLPPLPTRVISALAIEPEPAAELPEEAAEEGSLELAGEPDGDLDPAGVAAADPDPEPAPVVGAPVPAAAVTVRWTPADVHAALSGASARSRCIVRYEIGGYGYDPYVRGAQGERGPAQLHPRGLLNDFYRQGYQEPENPYQAVAYLEGALARGMAGHWGPVNRGLC